MKRRALGVLLVVLVSIACLISVWGLEGQSISTPTPLPWRDERLVPTPTPFVVVTRRPTPTERVASSAPVPATATATPTQEARLTLLPTAAHPLSIPPDSSWRFGALDRHQDLFSYDWEALNIGWFLVGAVCWVMPRESAAAILRDLGHIEAKSRIDARVGQWAQQTGRSVWYHTTSLVQHVGNGNSALGDRSTDWLRSAADFIGEEARP